MTKIVEPGAPLAYSEEYLAGPGTYDDGEQIRASIYGSEAVDAETMMMTVSPAGRTVSIIEKGDIVVGTISYVKDALASVAIHAIRGKAGSILQQVEGTLHVSKINNTYLADVAEVYQVGDVIRAKVLGMKGGPQLATDKPDLGVIKAFSKEDQTRVLVPSGPHLMDPQTNKKWKRKIADDYGSGRV
jgi:exosome complex component CSL4